MNGRDYKVGDRVQGTKGKNKGKLGTITMQSTMVAWVHLKWDGGKRESSVESASVEKVETE